MFKIFILLIYVFSLNLFATQYITPLPQKIEYDKAKALLGKKLYFDPILSRDNSVSCATCHDLERGGVDNLPLSFGINGQIGDINTPTVFNAIYNFRQMWDGRANSLSHQVQFPITNPKEMGNSFENLIQTLQKNAYYKQTFNKLYKNGITKENIGNALEEFQKTLTTPSPFDKYLQGNKDALTPNQKKGYQLFVKKGCISCHNGINLGGGLYARFGLINDSIVKTLKNKKTDNPNLGLYNVTKDNFDKYYFKVPTLRNVALTYPYLHNGRIKTLKEAIKSIAKAQLGLDLNDEEIFLIEEFFKSLNGKVTIIQ